MILREDWNSFIDLLKKLISCSEIKAIGGFFLWLIQVFIGDIFAPVLAGVGVLWIIDTLTGFWYVRSNPLITPESRKVYHGCFKFVIYFLLLSAGHQCLLHAWTGFLNGFIQFIIIFTETYSIGENIQKIAKLKGCKITAIDWIMKAVQGRVKTEVDNFIGGSGKFVAADSETIKKFNEGDGESAG
jgi:phage-related holin